MAITIKRERSQELVRQAAALTGQSAADVVESALERYLAELTASADSRRERALALIDLIHAGLTDDDREALRTHDLYDDAGLPR